jgi:transposase
MTMLAHRVDAVIGVDTHTDTHTAAICDARGGILATLTVSTDESGYAELLDAVAAHVPGSRLAWAVEGTGSYGAGLTDALHSWDAEVIEVRAAKRPRGQGKNDIHDAVAIARTALAGDAHTEPRRGQTRQRLRLITVSRNADVRTRTRLTNQLKSTVVGAPTPVRDLLRNKTTPEQVRTAARLRAAKNDDELTATTKQVLRNTARQIITLNAAINDAENQLDKLTTTHAKPLRDELGVGPVSAAQILISWSHPGRFPSEAAFASLAGTSPLEASSGRTQRHRLNRTGDRQLNAALHRVVLTRRAHPTPETTAYINRRTSEGKSPKDINRCLKRSLARHLHRLLETMPAMP